MWPSLLELLPLTIGRSRKLSYTLLFLYSGLLAGMLWMLGIFSSSAQFPNRLPLLVLVSCSTPILFSRLLHEPTDQKLPLSPRPLFRITPLSGEQDYRLNRSEKNSLMVFGIAVGLVVLWSVWQGRLATTFAHYGMGLLAVRHRHHAHLPFHSTEGNFPLPVWLYFGSVLLFTGAVTLPLFACVHGIASVFILRIAPSASIPYQELLVGGVLLCWLAHAALAEHAVRFIRERLGGNLL